MKLRLALALTAVAVAIAPGAAAAAVFNYTVSLNAASESPALTPAQSVGTGFGTVVYDNALHTLALSVTFSNLTGTTTISHFHAPTTVSGVGSDAAASAAGLAGVATTTPTLVGFPSGVNAGNYNAVLDLTQASSWNPAYVTANGGTTAGAEAAFATALSQGRTYWNIHTSAFNGGEIRGFPVLVPEPGAMALASAFLSLAVLRRRRS